MRSLSLLSGPKIRKAYFEASKVQIQKCFYKAFFFYFSGKWEFWMAYFAASKAARSVHNQFVDMRYLITVKSVLQYGTLFIFF